MLQYIGVHVLGISSTLTSVLSTLSLAELGFQQAVVFYLYKPLRNTDEESVNKVLTVLKRVYEIIGIIFIICAVLMYPFLGYILNGIVIDRYVIGYYIIMSSTVAVTYFVAYKRALLYADSKDYISKFIDSLINVIMSIIKILIIIYYKNYIVYLIFSFIQTLFSNLVVNQYCRKNYKFLSIEKFDWNIFRLLIYDVKNVFMSKIAGYVYGATDNLVISSFVGTIYVGYLANYVIFINAVKQIINSIFNSMTPIIGNMFIDNISLEKRESDFRVYSYIRYLFATAIVVPWILLADDLISLVFGEEYVLCSSIVNLLGIDIYIHIVYSACCEYINGVGLFKTDKNISVIGAVINLCLSVVLVNKMGVEGVLIGTVVSQLFFWIGRSIAVYNKIFRVGAKIYIRYWIKNIVWIFLMLTSLVLSRYIDKFCSQDNIYVSFFRLFIICELLNVLIQIVALNFMSEKKRLLQIIQRRKG